MHTTIHASARLHKINYSYYDYRVYWCSECSWQILIVHLGQAIAACFCSLLGIFSHTHTCWHLPLPLSPTLLTQAHTDVLWGSNYWDQYIIMLLHACMHTIHKTIRSSMQTLKRTLNTNFIHLYVLYSNELVHKKELQWNPSIYNGHLWGTMFWPLYIQRWPLLRGCFVHKTVHLGPRCTAVI